MDYKKKYKHIYEIFVFGKRIVDDFTDCDLSGLDLSNVPAKKWEGAIFNNTNFSETNIKFYPRELITLNLYDWTEANDFKYNDISNCDFSGCDLSYLTIDDLYQVKISGCNFTNTGLKVDFNKIPDCYGDQTIKLARNLSGVTLPKEYQNNSESY